jgi:hypothetical protein
MRARLAHNLAAQWAAIRRATTANYAPAAQAKRYVVLQ